MLYWCAVLVSAGWLGDLTEGFLDAFANLLQLSLSPSPWAAA